MKPRFRRAFFALATLLLATTLGAQTSPNYQLSNSGTVTIAGEATSPQFVARVIGGDGSPAQSASSQNYTVVLGSGGSIPGPVAAEQIFANGFEGSGP